MFSAAVPGQGGEDHINEQTYEFWRDKFAQRGYRLFDYLRPKLHSNNIVEPWYRYNLMLFVHDSEIPKLRAELQASRVGDNSPIADHSPPGYRIRKAILRQLPIRAVTRLANWKHRRAVKELSRNN